MMRIGFNALFLGKQGTGSGQYVDQLLRALNQVGPEHSYLLLGRSRDGGRSEAWPLRGLRTPFARSFDNLDKLWFEQITFPRACRRERVDLCHVPYFASPVCAGLPVVVTVHDLIPLLLPTYRGSAGVRLYMRLVAAAARRADQVITDSLCSRDDIVRHLHLPPERVHAIYLAAAPSCHRISDVERVQSVQIKYGLPDSYVLYLGGFDQRKNLWTLLQAYQRVCKAMGALTPALVVAGRLPSEDTPFTPDPRRMARELGVDHKVHFVGWITEEDKPVLYSRALLFVFLSLYEGFGLMPLEAMACGTPVLAARSSSLPEVVGTGGVLVNPTNAEEVGEEMLTVLRDADLRQQLGQRALNQAAQFDWKRTAERTLHVYDLATECDHLSR
jgi:glycosyltransferase involved in cell wall biosynthesis